MSKVPQKVHKNKLGSDFRGQGQTAYEYLHSTACGYVRDLTTRNNSEVTCKLCLGEIERAENAR